MHAIKLTILTLTLILVTVVTASSQNPQQEYKALTEQLASFKSIQDSTQNLINRNRQLLENRPENREQYSKAIISLEEKLYELNSRIASISAAIIALESQLPKIEVTTTGGDRPVSSSNNGAKESRNLYDNYIFTSNFTKNQLAQFNTSSSIEAQVVELIAQIETLYRQLQTLKAEYDSAATQEAVDELATKSRVVKAQIAELDQAITKIWLPLYNFKIDSYLVLIDKLGSVDRLRLEQIETDSRNIRRAETLAESMIAPSASVFNLQRSLALHYEMLIAENLDLRMAMDSLNRAAAIIGDENMQFEAIDFQPRELIIYGDVVMDGIYNFATVDEIPKLQLPLKGVYYAIQVAAMPTKPSSLNFFKGGRPLQQNHLPNGSKQYLLGGYKTYAAAQKAVTQLRAAGYKAPVAMAWLNGKSVSLASAKAAEVATQDDGKTYVVEVLTADPEASNQIRDIVNQYAAGRQIARIQQGDKMLYTISPFAIKVDAQDVMNTLMNNIKAEIKIVAIEEK